MVFIRLARLCLLVLVVSQSAPESLAFVTPLSTSINRPCAITPSGSQCHDHNVGKTNSPATRSCTKLQMDIVGVSPEPIHTAFALATFGPQPFWLLMILLPKNDITKKVMGSMGAFLASFELWVYFGTRSHARMTVTACSLFQRAVPRCRRFLCAAPLFHSWNFHCATRSYCTTPRVQ